MTLEAQAGRWLGLVEFPGYEVSNLGEVGSHFRFRTGNVLEPSSTLYLLTPIIRFGYRCFGLRRRDGKIKIMRGAILVLTAFIGPPDPRHVARHFNDVRDDDRLENLAWGTQSENMADARRNGYKPPRGEVHWNTALSDSDVKKIRSLHAGGMTQREIGDQFGLCQPMVSRIVNRLAWRHIS